MECAFIKHTSNDLTASTADIEYDATFGRSAIIMCLHTDAGLLHNIRTSNITFRDPVNCTVNICAIQNEHGATCINSKEQSSASTDYR